MICKVLDLDIYYETCGEGKPILMIHGYGIDHNVMVGCMEPIFKSRPGYRRIYFDLPGMGQSKAADWLNSSDQVLDVIVKFCDQVIPGEKFLVAGESYGGYLARGLVYKEPQRLDGVLLICPVVIAEKSKRELPPKKVFVRDEQMLAGIEPGSRKFFERMLVLQDERRWKRFQQDILPGMRSKDTAFTRRLMDEGYAFTFDVDRPERPFVKPSLVLAGRQDASVGFKDILKIIDDYTRGTFAVLDRAGHGLEVEQEYLFNSLTGEWLDRVEEEARLS